MRSTKIDAYSAVLQSNPVPKSFLMFCKAGFDSPVLKVFFCIGDFSVWDENGSFGGTRGMSVQQAPIRKWVVLAKVSCVLGRTTYELFSRQQ